MTYQHSLGRILFPNGDTQAPALNLAAMTDEQISELQDAIYEARFSPSPTQRAEIMVYSLL